MSLKIVYRPLTKDSKDGYLKVRVIENRKTKFQSLGIKINGKNWNETKQKVSSKEPNYEKMNLKIEETLKQLASHDNDIQVLQVTNKTILEFYGEVIDNTINQGTKLKYINIRKKFINYLKSKNLFDLKFNQLTETVVKEFYKYTIDSGNAVDTANYNIKSFKALISKAKKAGLVRYSNDPFINLQLKYSQKKLKSLTSEEVSRIINTRYKENRKFHYNRREHDLTLNEIAQTFLFQLFTQGLRCSDVQFLKWSNFKLVDDTLYIDYIMFKTKKEMRLNVTYMALKMMNIPLYRVCPELEDKIDMLEAAKIKLLKSSTVKTNLLTDLEQQIYSTYSNAMFELSIGEKANDFAFHFLKNEHFHNFKSNMFENLTAIQYSRFTGSRAYYNLLLKEIQKQCKINITLTSHVARHTYSQLLLENNADLKDISYSLGHMHISTTQTYISKLPSTNINKINTILSEQFNR